MEFLYEGVRLGGSLLKWIVKLAVFNNELIFGRLGWQECANHEMLRLIYRLGNSFVPGMFSAPSFGLFYQKVLTSVDIACFL